jgi:hypothetical protein
MFQMDTQKVKFASNRTIDLPKLKSFAHSIRLNSVHQQHPQDGSPHPIDQHKSIDQNGLRARAAVAAAHFRAAGTVSLIKAQSKANIQKRAKFVKTVAIFRLEKQTTTFITCAHANRWVVTRSKIPAVVQFFF